jgi:aspartyl-tRNA(Asn)/glutamyl-tRNA(Gln) amidotransferase subunit A
MLGQTNLDEFAMGSSNETSYFGPVTNPWRAAAAMTIWSRRLLGRFGEPLLPRVSRWPRRTDTGGRSASPAAIPDLVGLKPTYGRCSRWGIVAYASSFDQAGPMTRTVRDAAIMLRVMASHDPKDSTSVDPLSRL